MPRKYVFFIFVSVLAGLSLGSIRKSEDPIRDTQTNPILYQQKMEEEKDGKKGPLLYHVKNNPRESFFIDPPYGGEEQKSSRGSAAEETPADGGSADWWEEQPAETQATGPVEPAEGPVPGSFPEEKVAPDLAAEEPPVSGAEEDPSGKGDDYWW